MITFAKLRSGDWGVRVEGARPVEGTSVTVAKRDGSTTRVTLGEVVWADDEVTLFAIQARPRRAPTPRPSASAPVPRPAAPSEAEVRFALSDDEVARAFAALEIALAATPLRTSAGGTRIARAREFMLMHERGGSYSFKHRDSRNYVVLHGDRLEVPVRDAPFHRGEFDVYGSN